jgi:polyhydroxyalkanoate synthase subunit PhaE
MEPDFWRQWQALAGLAQPGQGSAASAQAPGFAPFIDGAERFAAAARSFFDRSDTSAAGTAAASQAFGDFLRDQFAAFFKPPWPTGASPLTGMSGSPDAPPAFLADAPALGLTREHQQRAQRAADAWRRMQAAQRRLERLGSDTLREAATAFATRLGAPASAALSADALGRLYDTWIDCAEEAYARTVHSEAFCDALADAVNAASQWRRESNAAIEQWAKFLDLPTRKEINTLAQRLRAVELRQREIKPQSAPKPPRKPRRAAPRKARPDK